MILEREISQNALFQQVSDWVYAEADAAHVAVTITPNGIEERVSDCYTFIMVPIKIHDESGAVDGPSFLAALEGKWNDQEPRPEKLIFPYPAGVPRYAV